MHSISQTCRVISVLDYQWYKLLIFSSVYFNDYYNFPYWVGFLISSKAVVLVRFLLQIVDLAGGLVKTYYSCFKRSIDRNDNPPWLFCLKLSDGGSSWRLHRWMKNIILLSLTITVEMIKNANYSSVPNRETLLRLWGIKGVWKISNSTNQFFLIDKPVHKCLKNFISLMHHYALRADRQVFAK